MLQCDLPQLQERNITSLKRELQSQLRGLVEVVAPWDENYETFRRIQNLACCQKPLLIARPKAQEVKYFSLTIKYL